MCERFPWLVGDGAAFCSAFLTGRADPLQITAFQEMVIRAKRMQYSCGIVLPEGYRVESYRTETSSHKGKSLGQLGQKKVRYRLPTGLGELCTVPRLGTE